MVPCWGIELDFLRWRICLIKSQNKPDKWADSRITFISSSYAKVPDERSAEERTKQARHMDPGGGRRTGPLNKKIWPAGMAGRPKMGQNNEKPNNNYVEIRKYMGNQLKWMDLHLKPKGMVGKWLGCIQPMCSPPGRSWQGPFFFVKSLTLFRKSAFFVAFLIKPPFLW